MDGSSTIEQPEPTTRKAFSLTAAQRAPLSVLSAALASFCFLFFLSCFLETCSTGMFLTAGALKSIFLLVCHRLNGATIERFAMHRSKRLEAKSITDQMIRFRRPDPQRLCTVATLVDMPNFRLFPQLTEMQEIGCFNELHNQQNFSGKRYPGIIIRRN